MKLQVEVGNGGSAALLPHQCFSPSLKAGRAVVAWRSESIWPPPPSHRRLRTSPCTLLRREEGGSEKSEVARRGKQMR
jgi:hypothetical protein